MDRHDEVGKPGRHDLQRQSRGQFGGPQIQCRQQRVGRRARNRIADRRRTLIHFGDVRRGRVGLLPAAVAPARHGDAPVVNDEVQVDGLRGGEELRMHGRRCTQQRMPRERQLLFHREDARRECRNARAHVRERLQEDRFELAHFLRDPLHRVRRQSVVQQENAQPVSGQRLAGEDIDETERQGLQVHVMPPGNRGTPGCVARCFRGCIGVA